MFRGVAKCFESVSVISLCGLSFDAYFGGGRGWTESTALLRISYGMSGTDIGHCVTESAVLTSGMVLRNVRAWCYEMCGTDIGYGGTRTAAAVPKRRNARVHG
eukprot:3338505-Rhodomonas_salina.2